MLRKASIILPFFLITFLTSCHLATNDPDRDGDEQYESEEDESDEQDGIREAQEYEFEITRDVKLGYIPKDRLIQAIEAENIKSKSGYASKVTALSWTERGPNTDAIGPSNGNSRGPLGTTTNASNVVTSGRVRAIHFDLADPSRHTVWIGGVSGGLWKSTDITSTSAAVWSVVNDNFGNLAIGGICQDPTNTDIMYFGTGEKTSNVDAVRGGGIWKSTDHGVSWTLLLNTLNFYNVAQMTCDASGNVYVATIGSNGIRRSTDGGASWTNITPTGLTTNVTEMKLSSTGRLHISCGYRNSGTAGYRFTDNPATVTSATWTSPTTSFPATYNVEIAVVGNTLYALPSDAASLTPAIYKSVDGGANWAPTPGAPPSTSAEPSINTGQGWYDLAIGADPNNPDNVIAGGLNFYKSTNGGATWTQMSRWAGTAFMYVHADHHNVTWLPGQVLLGTDGGVFYSSDNGNTFTDRNDGLRLKQFYACAIHPTTANYFLAGAQDNGTHQLTSPGLGGSIEVWGGDGAYVHIDQNQPQYQFTAVTYSNYRRSTNGGNNWTSVNYSSSVGQFINPTDYDDVANIMYCSGANGQYVRWDNPQTGSSFTPVSVPALNSSSVRAITVSPYTSNRVFFGTAGGRIVRVDDADATPTGVNITGSGMPATNVSCVAVGTSDNNLVATYSNYGSAHVWISSNGGTSWVNISGNLPDIPVRWAMFYPEDNSKVMLATEMGIFETDLINGASTVWERNTSFPSVKTTMLQYRRSDGTVLAATHGRGLWTAQIAPAAPYIRFEFNSITKKETSTAVTATCRRYTDHTVNMLIDQAPTGTASVTLNISAGSATEGVDFDVTTNGSFASPSKILSFADGSVAPQPIIIRVYDDAEVEATETFTLSYNVSGTTNAVGAPSSSAFTLNLEDNDFAPVGAGLGTATVGTGSYAGGYVQPFRSSYQNARSQYLYLASELRAAGLNPGNITALSFNVLSKVSVQPFPGLTISMRSTAINQFTGTTMESGLTEVYSQNYSTVVGVNTFTLNAPFAWDGTSNIIVQICYSNGTATAGSGDAVASSETSAIQGIWNRDATQDGCTMVGAFNQSNAVYVRADISFSGYVGNPIDTVANASRTEDVNNANLFYFYNGNNILTRIANASANLGCVTATNFEAGNTWQSFEGGERSGKVLEVTPSANTGASYNIGLYFTAAELAGKSPATLRIAKTTAPNMAAANSNNTVITNAVASAYGAGWLFTGDFTGFSKFFLVNDLVVLPVDLVSFSGYLNNNGFSELVWKASNPVNLKQFDVQRSYDGVNFGTLGTVMALRNPANIQEYNFTDVNKAKAVNFYRLKMIDTDGRSKYSAVIRINNNRPAKFVELLQNPVRDNIAFMLDNSKNEKVTVWLVSSSGQQVKRWDLGKQQGTILLPLDHSSISAGTYILRVSAGNKTENIRIVKR